MYALLKQYTGHSDSDQLKKQLARGINPRSSFANALEELVTRLDRAAEQLRSGELSPDAAATLVEDCAALASQASVELERLARAAAQEPLPGQDSLL